ncbi:TIGR03088 family PEP-CTERM/XrtA system glycosyltransferase [Neptunicella marina]|uniref:TIGR03088 family PEP-CTERM/XrtA system glycosyltransferase n=1 Tax=Neptunicella marina TaxID=2125989 RepID=A0A8J6LXQ2_9ALTE|nr:TIGR03088 family PEP-CTERM/XrtA system glycosyltransferase [Neptunicella marina]MBC3765759.1 TIGR03088 family PEP-CTERM/XrtA system glycosyltransferase [Neptunicella marina]
MTKKHVAHIIYRLSTGGLENGLVNLVNRLPQEQYQHSIITLNGFDAEFAKRIQNDNVQIFDLKKAPGWDLHCFVRLFKLLRKLRPDCLHTRNLNSMEYQLVGWLNRVPLRIHGEHGWDTTDLGGTNVKNQKIRRLLKGLVHQFIGLSTESISYLRDIIGVPVKRIHHICNGVDTNKFQPENEKSLVEDCPFPQRPQLIFGTVGRLAAVKNQTLLMQAFIDLCNQFPHEKNNLGLIIVGDGMLKPRLQEMIQKVDLEKQVWLAGNRQDIDHIMPTLDVFVLPSLAEGISNTILEAMACGVPVIATRVGGNPDLIAPSFHNTHLVASDSPKQMTAAMAQYIIDTHKIETDKKAVRLHCQQHFSIDVMVNKYHNVYQTAG